MFRCAFMGLTFQGKRLSPATEFSDLASISICRLRTYSSGMFLGLLRHLNSIEPDIPTMTR